MIPRANRFHGHSSLKYVYSHGQISRGPLLSLKYILNKKRTKHRVAVVVSKKVLKSAVARNRVRRRIYEQMRRLASQISQPYDVVISIYSDKIYNASADEIQEQLETQLKNAGILG